MESPAPAGAEEDTMTTITDATRDGQDVQTVGRPAEDVAGFMIPAFVLAAAERGLKAQVPPPFEYGGRIPTRKTVTLRFN
jgi:hypothetical protein